jgi:hypothetical protein
VERWIQLCADLYGWRDRRSADNLVLSGAGAVKVAVQPSVRSMSDTNGTAQR